MNERNQMVKTVILAGGFGTRLSEETYLKPKPMVEIGGKPILWHIMKIFSHYDFNDFIICCGYKGYVIKEFFANYFLHTSDITFHMKENKMIVHSQNTEPWKVTLIDTGENTLTGGRLARIKDYLDDDSFFFTYGDGLANINLTQLLEHHKNEGKEATLTAVKPPGRYGALRLENNFVTKFQEKADGDKAWINGGFFVLQPSVLDYIDGDFSIWERDPLVNLSNAKELTAFKHRGFWQPMDNLRDRNKLEDLWQKDEAYSLLPQYYSAILRFLHAKK